MSDEIEGLRVNVNVDASEVNETLEKVERLQNLLKEANSLADELAEKEIAISLLIND